MTTIYVGQCEVWDAEGPTYETLGWEDMWRVDTLAEAEALVAKAVISRWCRKSGLATGRYRIVRRVTSAACNQIEFPVGEVIVEPTKPEPIGEERTWPS